MKTTFSNIFVIAGVTMLSYVCFVDADIYSLVVKKESEPLTGHFNLGTNKDPWDNEISINSRNLTYNNSPWLPIMGEFHFSRYPQKEWKSELQKIKDGGIEVVTSYVFWNHHEEIEGEWDWKECKDLRKFLAICKEVGLLAIVRIGPWCNGEVRYGGFPDWVQNSSKWEFPKDKSKRPNSPEYFAAVQKLYQQIGEQLNGLLWKNGGPVIGIQIDNEYSGTPDHLLTLKKIAREAGMDVPLYTKTGWPKMEKQMPLGELIPLYGAYPDAAWESSYEKFEGLVYNYSFRSQRTDEFIANDFNQTKGAEDETTRALYPFLTAETGGGMFVSYHRRIVVDPKDVASLALCQLGSGCAGIGYYMYHGGENPEGKNSYLNKSQEIGDIFDTNIKSYDFQAPIGQYGQIRPHYKWLRRLHFFLDSFGSSLAQMQTTLPYKEDTDFSNLDLSRWSVRSHNNEGFIFVNNYQRLTEMPEKKDICFEINLPSEKLIIPPITIPSDSFFILPFNLPINSFKLVYATAQVVGIKNNLLIFAAIPGIPSSFVFDKENLDEGQNSTFFDVQPGRNPAFTLKSKNGQQLQVILLNEEDSLNLCSFDKGLKFDQEKTIKTQSIPFVQVKHQGTTRNWKSKVEYADMPSAPNDEDFNQAACWELKLPKSAKGLLTINYIGDTARLYAGKKLIADNFYTGEPFEVGLERYKKQLSEPLILKILPLQKEMPIYFEPGKRPDFQDRDTVLELKDIKIVSEISTKKASASSSK